jgi:glycosyltransferase involved in cell wall biosynthesis
LVLFEALASRTPFVTSACGNAEEIIQWTHGGVAVPTIEKKSDGTIRTDVGTMARAIEELISDDQKLHQLANAGYRSWRERFTWEKIAIQYEELYTTLLRHNSVRLGK